MRNRLLALAALVFAAGPARAFQSRTGGDAAEFLQVGAGARSLGMGEAYGPVAEGAEAIYWNPAGLARLHGPQVTYSRQEFASYLHHDFLAVAVPVHVLGGAVGASYTRMSQESLPLVTNANQTIGSFNPHSDVITLGYAHAFDSSDPEHADRDYFSDSWGVPGAYHPLSHEREVWTGSILAGFAAKAIYDTIYNYSAQAIALDAGALFRPSVLPDLTVSGTIRNLGGKMKYVTESEALPTEADLGVSYDVRSWSSRFLPAFEIALPYYGSPYAKLGAEYEWPIGDLTRVAVRAGYKSQTVPDLGYLSGITFGLGMQYRKFSADFGFQPMAELGEVFRVTVGARW